MWRTGFTADSCDSTGKRGYVFDLAGHVIVENNSSGTSCQGQVYVGERHFGRQSGGTFFYHADWLGTVRFINSDGYPTQGAETCTSLPFGDGLNCNSNYGNVWHFTGKERDYESGLDNFGARYDASNFGRFMSPDDFWKDSHGEDPQSWNKYAYARNNPLRYIDPTGEEATVTTNCICIHDQKTCSVKVSATIAIYAAPNSGLTADQLGAAAGTIKQSIEGAWNGSFSDNGVTYNVSTAVSVSVVDSLSAGVSSGAQNVIGIANGAATQYGILAEDFVAERSLGQTGPDVGIWNFYHLGADSPHEFTHMLGVRDQDGYVMSNPDHTLRPDRAQAQDYEWALRGVIDAVHGRAMYTGSTAVMLPGASSISETVKAPLRKNWYRPQVKGVWQP